MFELGLDQAHGLKRLFLPPEFGRVRMIGIDSPPGFADAVIGVGRSLISRGFDVRWDDPEDLLRGQLPGSGEHDGTRITVTAAHHSIGAAGRAAPIGADTTPDESSFDSAAPGAIYSIFSAAPQPSRLTSLYAAIKRASVQADAMMDERPLTIMWCGPAIRDAKLRGLCETNLTQAAERFLARPIEFIDAPATGTSDQPPSRLPAEIAEKQFMERLAALLVSRLEQANPGMAPCAN